MLTVRTVFFGSRGFYFSKFGKDVVETNAPYRLGKKECNHVATLKIGDKPKSLQFMYLSNEPVSGEEFQAWLKWLGKLNEAPPNKLDLDTLKKQIKDADEHHYTEEEINEQIKKSREKNPIITNYAKEKLRIQQAIDTERVNGNITKVMELERQYQDVSDKEKEQHALAQKAMKVDLAQINKKKQREKCNFAGRQSYIIHRQPTECRGQPLHSAQICSGVLMGGRIKEKKEGIR